MKLSRPSIALLGLLGATSLIGCDQKLQERGYVQGKVISEFWPSSDQRRKWEPVEFEFAIETSEGRVYAYTTRDAVAMDTKVSIGDEVRIFNDHHGYQIKGFYLPSSYVEVIKRAK